MSITPTGDQKKYRVAFLTPANPIDADSGGKQFSLDRLLHLSELADIDVFCLKDTSEQRHLLSEKLSGRPVYSAGELKPRTALHWIESVIRGIPLSVWRNDVTELSQLIARHRSTHYDVIYIDHWLMWPASQQFNVKARRILNLHNAEHLIFERAAQNYKGIMRGALQLEAFRVRRYLRQIGAIADTIHAISETDRSELSAIGIQESRITAILPCVDSSITPAGKPHGRILFAGTLSWAPNAEGLEWFLREVLPNLPVTKPIQVIGGEPPSTWRHLPASTKVEFLGRVPSVDLFYKDAGVLIAPVFSGSGIKLKIVNSLARGLPVVTTTCGIEGFPPGWESAVRVCDDPLSFGQAVHDIINDIDGWKMASRQARQYAARYFSSETAQFKLKECLNV